LGRKYFIMKNLKSILGIAALSVSLVVVSASFIGCSSSSNTKSADTADDTAKSTYADSSAKAVVNITKTIVVKAGATYDGGGATIIAKGMGDGGQGENQEPIFKLEKGAKLKNVVIGAPGCDGIHCYGDNTLTSVKWADIGEDALTVKGSGSITINGGSAVNGYDKCFQINQPCTFTVNNFTASNIGKFIRQNGDTTFKATVYINGCTVNNAKDSVGRTDSKTTLFYYRNLKTSGCSTLWKVPSMSQVKSY
jgi:hypothetical protein